MTEMCITIQSHCYGHDVDVSDYELPFTPARIVAVYRNMVTGYCGGEDDPAVGKVVSTGSDLARAVGYPGGYEHCRVQIVVESV